MVRSEILEFQSLWSLKINSLKLKSTIFGNFPSYEGKLALFLNVSSLVLLFLKWPQYTIKIFCINKYSVFTLKLMIDVNDEPVNFDFCFMWKMKLQFLRFLKEIHIKCLTLPWKSYFCINGFFLMNYTQHSRGGVFASYYLSLNQFLITYFSSGPIGLI